MRKSCNGGITKDNDDGKEKKHQSAFRCYLSSNSDLFIKLGPFKIEFRSLYPFLSIFHDFFLETEMKWMISHSLPRLTKERLSRNLMSSNNTVGKAIQTWFSDIEYVNNEIYRKTNRHDQALHYDVSLPSDPYNFLIKHETMIRVSHRIELATKLNVTKRRSSTMYQTTCYGLAGMVTTHHDAYGYEKGRVLTEKKYHLSYSGDTMATFMGWINEPAGGGYTVFPKTNTFYKPIKGDAVFWVNLSSSHYKERNVEHTGCPVLKGSKWILNKWIFSYDQWDRFPCLLNEFAHIRMIETLSNQYP